MSHRRVVIATSNRGKIREFRQLLSSLMECLGPDELGVAVPKVLEDGTSYYENSLKKAIAFQRTYELPVLADDSGLEIDVLDGAPGVLSARLGGEGISWAERWTHLYALLSPFEAVQWTARFRCVLCFYQKGTVPVFFEAVTEGSICPKPRGSSGFGYDPIFYSSELKKSFGEASMAEKELISHRGRAARLFSNWLEHS